MRAKTIGAGLLAVLAASAVQPAAPVRADEGPAHVEGTLASGATYVMDVPAGWNGTVLLYSHGYVTQGQPNPARAASNDAVRDAALAQGYALIGSSYAKTGWAVGEAVPDQLATLAEFTRRFGAARKKIAWGTSYGGLITTALAERHGRTFDGTLAMCGLQQGGIAHFNALLDTTFAVKTLIGGLDDVPLTGVPDQATATQWAGRVTAALKQAQETPEGRARIALAASLYNLPSWPGPMVPEPAPDDYETWEVNQARHMVGPFFNVAYTWRAEIEARTGGNVSWNTGVDYRALVEKSSDRAEVHALYAKAGLSLDGDLGRLKDAQRVKPSLLPAANLAKTSMFTGDLKRPMLTVHTTGDGVVPIQAQTTYRNLVRAAGDDGLLARAYVRKAGHCSFGTGEVLAAVKTLEARIDGGTWTIDPASLNDLAGRLDPAVPPKFTGADPGPYLRPFDVRGGS
ncbi:alpha/beta hydrolase family protein [Spirillospora sp. CA-294931]|uniref:alpha/beta hydrolase family protein n=1 Tax=Spirillospora sp. CA-294931 TaxID=3240042 RepID=UPI003D8CD4F4